MLALEGELVQSLVRELRSYNLHGAPHPKKKLSVCGDPVCHLHWDWATSTALPLGAHCSHQFLRITVAQLIFGLFAPNIILISGSANFGFSLYLHFVFLSTFT